jgi:hypothetical protein
MHTLLAWTSANIMNATGNLKKTVTTEDLLGKKDKKDKTKQEAKSKEEQEQELSRLKEQFGFS